MLNELHKTVQPIHLNSNTLHFSDCENINKFNPSNIPKAQTNMIQITECN